MKNKVKIKIQMKYLFDKCPQVRLIDQIFNCYDIKWIFHYGIEQINHLSETGKLGILAPRIIEKGGIGTCSIRNRRNEIN